MPLESMDNKQHLNLTTPPNRRENIKHNDHGLKSRAKRQDALRELGRQQRHATLQKLRHSLSPVDLKGKLHADTMAAIREELHQPADDGGVLTEADIDAILRNIEEQVLQEIQAELAELERVEHEQQQHAACMAEQHMAYLHNAALQEDGNNVLCPVCKSAQLQQRQGLLVCPSEGWRLNLSAEGLNMDNIKARLAAAYEEHGAAGCPGHLAFHIEDIFGSSSLTCSCGTCNTLAVVL